MKKMSKKNISKYVLLMVLPLFIILLPFTGIQSVQAAQSSFVVGTVKVTPLQILLSARSSVFVNQNFNFKAVIENVGQDDINNVVITLGLPENIILTNGELVQNIGTLKKRRKETINWKMRASQAGTFIIQVSASGIDQGSGNPITASSSRIINVKNKRFFNSIFESWAEFFQFIFQRQRF